MCRHCDHVGGNWQDIFCFSTNMLIFLVQLRLPYECDGGGKAGVGVGMGMGV